MKLISTLGALILLASALLFYETFIKSVTLEQQERQREHDLYHQVNEHLTEIQEKFAAKMWDELNLIHVGTANSIDEKANSIGMQFHAYRRATIEEARALHLYVQDKLVDAINAHESFRPFLAEYPFARFRVSVAIYFKNDFGSYMDGSVSCVFTTPCVLQFELDKKNHRYYKASDPFTHEYTALLNETYEEAVKRSSESSIADLTHHQATPLEEAIDRFFLQYAEDMKNKYRLQCVSVGGKIQDKIEEISVSFIKIKPPKENEARKFILLTTEKLLEMINSDEQLKPYFIEPSLQTDRLKIRISFRNSRYYPYRDGSIESVTLEGNKIHYFQDVLPGADYYPLYAPCIATETYEEAKKKVIEEMSLKI